MYPLAKVAYDEWRALFDGGGLLSFYKLSASDREAWEFIVAKVIAEYEKGKNG